MSGSSNLNSFRDRGQVAVQLVSCGVLLPGLRGLFFSKCLLIKFKKCFPILIFESLHKGGLNHNIFRYLFLFL